MLLPFFLAILISSTTSQRLTIPKPRLSDNIIEYALSPETNELSLQIQTLPPTLLSFAADSKTRTLIKNPLLLDALNVMSCQLYINQLQPPSAILKNVLSNQSKAALLCHTDNGDDKSFQLRTFEQQHVDHQESMKSVIKQSMERAVNVYTTESDSQTEINSVNRDSILDKFKNEANNIKQDFKDTTAGIKKDFDNKWQDLKKHWENVNENAKQKVEDVLGFEHREFPYESVDLIGATASGLAAWSYQFAAHHWGKLHSFPIYNVLNNSDPNTGIYNIETGQQLSMQQSQSLGQKSDTQTVLNGNDNAIRFSIAADWAAGTRESWTVAKLMDENSPQWTLHLGDVYYVGTEDEVKQNVLGVPPQNCLHGVKFPHGSLGSLFVMGNHEMYSRAYGFYDTLLPTKGVFAKGFESTQKAGVWVQESADWRIIGLDTGYSTYSIKLQNDNVTLPQESIDWLRDVVHIGNPNDTRGLIFLTHHQPLSAFDKGYPEPANQLADLLPPNRTILWLFGHEHRLSFYDKQTVAQGRLTLYPRCVGNGGFPSQLAPLPARAHQSQLTVYDDRVYQLLSGIYSVDVGFNGWFEMDMNGPSIDIEYKSLMIDPQTNTLSNTTFTTSVKESFLVDRTTGNVEQTDFQILDANLTVVKYYKNY